MSIVRHKITAAGQISIPADVRRRWKSKGVFIEDRGDHLIVRPTAADAIEAAWGALKGKGRDLSAAEMIRLADEDERRAEARRERLWSSWTRSR